MTHLLIIERNKITKQSKRAMGLLPNILARNDIKQNVPLRVTAIPKQFH